MNKLGLKIFIIFLLVSIGGLLLTSVFINYRFNFYFENYLRDIREDRVNNLKNILEDSYNQNNNWNEAQQIIGNFSSLNDFKVILRDQNQEIIAFSTPNMFGRTNQSMMGRMQFQGSNLSPIDSQNYASVSLYKNDLKIGELLWQRSNIEEIFSNTEDIFMRHINRAIFIVALLTGLIVIIITYFFSKYLTGSLNKMNRVVKKIEEGNLDQTIEIKGNDEIADLAESFNQMINKLKYLEKIRKESASDLAHELRTPLSNIKNYVEAVQDNIIKVNKETLDEIEEELDRLVFLVDRLNDLNEADAKILRIDKSYLDFKKLITKIIKSFSIQVKNKSLEIVIDKEFDQKIKVYGDKKAIEQIFYNLISNAIKYSYENSKILINYKKDKNYDIIKMVNRGPKIDQEDIPYLFDRFYRVDKSRKKQTGGLGIGLTITRNLIEAHSGKVEVESKDNTTVFTVYIPRG